MCVEESSTLNDEVLCFSATEEVEFLPDTRKQI